MSPQPEYDAHDFRAAAAGKHHNVEPAIDADSPERLDEEILEVPHEATHFDAGTGGGTVSGVNDDAATQDRPLLDGSTMSPITERTVPNPYRGVEDPATITRQPALNSTSTNRWLFSGVVATALMSLVLLLLAQYNPLPTSIAIVIALAAMLLMLLVRLTGIETKLRLRFDAILLAVIWLVPLSVIVTTLITYRDLIW